ncbi:small multidrug efflux protein [Saxibacter everestensis]|uniref:Small multidrug efflux protein n=1 Tax=Saxibacter everestensis TaxID=2909229 RepID=A0ABY8QW49_9MICO|nr:small multidrug efflux protein [Brevibacteriaceae bacterium ZFBP1038]
MNDNPVANLIIQFQEIVAQVPDPLQPLIVAAAGAVPFIEGEGATLIGVVGGLHPVVAALAAATGNLLCVVVVVLLGARARGAIVQRAGRDKAGQDKKEKPRSKGRERFQRWFVRFGVPGASLLGPLAIPTQFTAATLVASGVSTGRVILWQAIAIVLWAAAVTAAITGAIAIAT